MKSFVKFFESYVPFLLQEAMTVNSSIDTLVGGSKNTAIFAMLGRDYIEDKFAGYDSLGVIPKEKKHHKKSRETNTLVSTDVTEEEEAMMKTYIFKYVDDEVKKDIEAEIQKMNKNTYNPFDDPNVTKGEDGLVDKEGNPVEFDKEALGQVNKLNNAFQKNYKGHLTRLVPEDYSRIKGVLQGWVDYKNKKYVKSDLLQGGGINFSELAKQVEKALAEARGKLKKADKKTAENPDIDIPKGMHFIKEVNGMRLYKWTETGDIYDRPKMEQQKWLAMTKNERGSWDFGWCVCDKNIAMGYGEGLGYNQNGSTEEVFKYPFFLIRKKDESTNLYMPYVLMHGQSLQCKDSQDDPVTKEIADEIRPVIEDDIEEIVYGDEANTES